MKTTRKPLPPDCLLGGRVHPSIAERLERVKQLPVAAVTNYLGLENRDGRYELIWQAIDARPLSEMRSSADRRSLLLDQLRQIVEAMHSHGIIHGAIDSSTVLVDASNRVHLTHVSPLLYDDPQIDLAAIDLLAGRAASGVANEPIDTVRHRQWRSIVVIAGVGLLMFFGLLWYSQRP